jgi:serine/threonine protein kinase
MPDTNPQRTLDTDAPTFRLRRLESAWLAWRAGDVIPCWQQHLPADDEPCSPHLIFELLQLDIDCRIKANRPALLSERYFEHPRLQRDDARLDDTQELNLIQSEYEKRLQQGQRPSRADYEAAFPRHSESLRQLKPLLRCRTCGKVLVLEETYEVPRCPDCGHESALPAAPPFVAPATPPISAPTSLDPRKYELMDVLGQGGMGEVYRCCDPALGRDLAIKVIKADYRGYPQVERRFLREARITGSLQHPGIVAVHNLGRLADGRLHYTMRLVRGQTFDEILKNEVAKPERLPYLLSIFEKICQAVAFAHSKRVIHRDLKPANVMVGRFGEVQVMDWGLAKVLPTEDEPNTADGADDREDARIHTEVGFTPLERTRMGGVMGTIEHMSPEQALGEWDTVDERADVFALGSMLCVMLTGQPAYRGTDREEVYRRAKRGDVAETLARLQQCGADAALTALCRGCLSPNRNDRPHDADAVAKRVAQYQDDVQARLRQAEVERAQTELKMQEGRKRRRWEIAFGVVLLAGAALSSWQAVRATNEKTKARESESVAQDRLKEIEKANDILAAIFHDLDPRAEEMGGPSLRLQMSVHVEKAVAQLDEVAIGDPLTAARLHYTLGQSLSTLGRTQKAISLLSKSYQNQEETIGSDAPDTLNSLHALAGAYHADGQADKSVALMELCWQRRKAKLGPHHPDTLATLNSLAGIYLATHQFDKVEPFLADLEAHASIDTLEDLAAAYFLTGQIDRAIPLKERVLEMQKAKSGLDDPRTLRIISTLAAAYRKSGWTDKAIPMYEQILPKQMKLSPDHRDTLATMQNLGVAYMHVGRLRESVTLLEQSWQKWKVKIGYGNPGTRTVLVNLVRAYQMAGEFDRVDPLLHEEFNGERTKGSGPDSATTLLLQTMLGFNLLSQHKYTEAEALLRDCLKRREAKQPNDWERFNTCSLLGAALFGQKKYVEAEPLLLQGYEGMKHREGKIPTDDRIRLIEALERLIQFYEATNHKDEAAKWRKLLEERKSAQKKLQP